MELVLLTPLLFLALSFVIVAGRLGTIRGEVAAASRDAARAASLEADFDQASAAAQAMAAASLGQRGVACSPLTVTVADPTGFEPGGEVTVSVRCQVSLADVAIPGLPGSRAVGTSSTEVIDSYRGEGR